MPVAVDDSATVIEDDPATPIDVLANDTGADPIAIESVDTTGTHGEVAITNEGADLTYRPNPDYCNDPDPDPADPIPVDAFLYMLNGGSTATVSVMVTCADDYPTAADDSVTLTEDAALTAIDVLGNDSDVDGGAKRIDAIDATGTNGHVELGTELTRPNIVLILTDDQSFGSLAKMPYLSSRDSWYRFDNAFINNPTCCPSRATILTGQWSHHTGVEATGGAPRFDDRSTIATWLDAAGYRTGLFGKYHLGSVQDNLPTTFIPPGWDEWAGWQGLDGRDAYYDYTLNQDGTLVPYGSDPDDYSTDVLAGKAVDFIDRNAGDPFFLYFAPRAPHNPWIPAPRHQEAYLTAPVSHAANFNEADMTDKPAWWAALAPRNPANMNAARRKEWATLLAADDAVESIVDTLKTHRLMNNTVVAFMTDNGYAFGEHRWQGKVCAYEECSRTPLLVWYPGSTRGGRVSELVGNEDIAPTFADLAGVAPGAPVDGDSFAPMLRTGEAPADWDDEVLLRGFTGPGNPGNPPTFWGMRTREYKYIETVGTGEVELYDLSADPFELESVAGQAAYADVRAQLSARLAELRSTPPGPAEDGAGAGEGSDDILSYAPDPDYCNEPDPDPVDPAPDDSFTYTLNGGSTATVSVQVSCVDDRPRAVGDSLTVAEDAATTTIDVVANDIDAEGDPVAVESVDATAANGQVAIGSSGTDLTYTPDRDYCNTDASGPGFGPDDAFKYTLSGGSTATVSVEVGCVDDAPLAVNDMKTVLEDAPATAIKVRGNDTDVDGGPKVLDSVDTAGTLGSAAIAGGGSEVEYRPPADYCNRPGTGPFDTFTYTLNGGSTATVSVKVSCVDDGPKAVDDSATVFEDASATTIDVLANDTDVDGGLKRIESVDTTGAAGNVTITDETRTISYRPSADYCNRPGTGPLDTFTYTANGGAAATVSVEVVCLEDAPTAVDDHAAVSEDGRERTMGVLINDVDVDGGLKRIELVNTWGTVGAVAITENARAITYRPSPDYCNRPGTGPLDTFTYTVNGGSTATVSIGVSCVDDAPTAFDDHTAVTEDGRLRTIGVLANDTDVDGGLKRIEAVDTTGTVGFVEITENARGIDYRPSADYCNRPGTGPLDTFTYALNGGSTAIVSVEVRCRTG